jgi:hypothetical protein
MSGRVEEWIVAVLAADVDGGQVEVKDEASRKAGVAPMEELKMKREDEVQEGMSLQWIERSLHHQTSKWIERAPDKQSKVRDSRRWIDGWMQGPKRSGLPQQTPHSRQTT